MRLLYTTFLALVSLVLFSQSPERINYQSIVRDLAGNVIQNQPISLRMSILSDSINGTIVYQETFQPTTNNFGLVNIKIGQGTPVIATISSVDWSNGPFFLESAVDVTGGTNYIVVSTSQFMSVPYALYASESPLDTTLVQNMIDNSVTNIDSSTVASWGYIDSSSIMILINNNSLDSAAVQNMINSSITNVDSSTVASWGYLDSSSIVALISNSNIDSSSVANWGYLDSVSIQNMINNSSVNVDSAMIANFGFVAGPHTIDTDTQIDSTGIANYGFVTTSQILDSSSVQNMINNSSSNIDSTTISNMGFVDSMTVVNMINSSGGSGGFNFIDPVYLFYTTTEGYGGRHPNSELVYNAGNPNNPPGYKESIYASITKVNPITNNISPNGSDSLLINFDSILGNHYDNILCYYDVGGEGNSSNSPFIFSMIYESDGFKYPLIRDYLNTSSSITASKQASGNLIIRNSNTGKINLYYTLRSNSFNADAHMDLVVIGYNNSVSNTAGSGSGNSVSHYVGEQYAGGVVFYVDNSGQHGLIVSTTDANSSGAQWSTSFNNISNCDSKINGYSNTLSILNNGNGPAALLCDSYNSGGYNDWYLPAIWEFNLLFKNAYPVLKTLEGISNSDFFQETYWTSTQGSNPVYAYVFRLVSSSLASHMITWAGKNISYAVRPIRKF